VSLREKRFVFGKKEINFVVCTCTGQFGATTAYCQYRQFVGFSSQLIARERERERERERGRERQYCYLPGLMGCIERRALCRAMGLAFVETE